ncbi:ead/Ea22-like family protein [Klebsiella pneumoniae]|uniref:ead/Ea22-like family protein n=1 Tax=Klebsiella pneumoniae TaxID=573 RepID=UPI003B5256BD
MTDITELAQSLKAAAENAGADYWQAKKISGDFYVIRKGSYKREYGYVTYQPIAEIDHKPARDYMAMASPANVLALVEALEKAQAENTAGVAGMAESYETTISMLRSRIAELESRTVKLPDFRHERFNSDWGEHDAEAYQVALREALTAAGIQVEDE